MFWKPPLYNSVKGVTTIGVQGVAVLGNFVLSLYIDIHLKTGYNFLLLMYE